jgi:hypothetical protein
MPDVFTATHDAAPKDSIGMFSTFCQHPEGITLSDQEKNEHIILFLRRHILTTLPWVLTTILLAIAPPLLLLADTVVPESLPTIPGNYAFVLFSFYYLVILAYPIMSAITWFYNIGIITNLRVIDIDSHNILHQAVASTNLADIVDSEYSQKGIIASHFDYGDVFIQTEGIKPNFEFHATPKPAKVVNIIGDLLAGRVS